MKTQDWINEQKIEAVQDRKDGKNYWETDNLYTEADLIELMEAFVLYRVSQGTELLPDFLYKNSFGETTIGYHGDTEVSEEWDSYLKKLGNCG